MAQKKENVRFDLETRKFLPQDEDVKPDESSNTEDSNRSEQNTWESGPSRRGKRETNEAGEPAEKTEEFRITDSDTLHRHLSDAIEKNLPLGPIWYAVDRNSLQYDENNTQIAELSGGLYQSEKKSIYVVKIDSENRYCDILRKVSVLEYVIMNLRVLRLLKRGDTRDTAEEDEESKESNILRSVKAAILHSVLETIMKILENGKNVIVQGMFLSGDYIYPAHRQPGPRQLKAIQHMSLYEQVLHFAGNIACISLKVDMDTLRGVDIDLSLSTGKRKNHPPSVL
ncbi:hypothetical protein P0082_08310 [Candidatus Haliotispira prima]|uniref:Uncharacterized protein n=1 Tax=Candidatus Haliotispira prima TaxID=3034016 RepID=A0ABY8MER5_9SPIO|nr:hypothetical protein P0082_08310 [Candidatus Haliotispira prima]